MGSNGTPGRAFTSYEEKVKDAYERRMAARAQALKDAGMSPTEFKQLDIKAELGPASFGIMGDNDGWHFPKLEYKHGTDVNKGGPKKALGWGLSVKGTAHNDDWKFKNKYVKKGEATIGGFTGGYDAENGDVSAGLRWPPSFGGSLE